MKSTGAFLIAVMLTACATGRSGHESDPPSLVPPAETSSGSPAVSDAKLSELQTSMTELLERLDVLNARIVRLEAGQSMESHTVPSADAHASPAPVQQPTVAAASPVPFSGAEMHVPAAGSAPPRALHAAAMADSYRSALMLYGKGRFADARASFQQVFDAEPSGELADNALYWIGETWFAVGDYATAMKFYQRVTAEYGETNKAPDSMFKTGMAFEKTGDLGMARKTFEECIRRYPYSTPASSAKLELKRIRY